MVSNVTRPYDSTALADTSSRGRRPFLLEDGHHSASRKTWNEGMAYAVSLKTRFCTGVSQRYIKPRLYSALVDYCGRSVFVRFDEVNIVSRERDAGIGATTGVSLVSFTSMCI